MVASAQNRRMPWPVGPPDLTEHSDRTAHDDLAAHLVRSTGLAPAVAERVIADVAAYFSEPADAYVRRRHRELQARGLANPEIFEQIDRELRARPVAAPQLSHRQLRRLVYG